MKCPVCGKAELVHDTRDLPYTYKGRTYSIEAVEADWCAACGESLTGPGETDRVMRRMREINSAHDAAAAAAQGAAAEPERVLIVRVRKRFAINQREAGFLFGGGPNAFSRYETGKTSPPKSVVQLFKVLDKHPELIDEIRSAGAA